MQKNKERIAAIDYGTVRLGVAISDATQKIALPSKLLSAQKNLEETAAHVCQSLSAYSPLQSVVIGLPLFMNGKESPMSTQVRNFGKLLEEKTGVPVIFWDERLTTAMVERTLIEADIRRDKRKQLRDNMAACALLQNYLDSRRGGGR